ncbi:MAG TPA: peptidoglycan recognition family protein [Pseudonocardiaceae bacterium]|nr:peptidoglycan recognition family protein [Pseudonocardiaceae bacterium]
MYLTNLADIAHSGGVTVVERAGWRTRGHGGMSGVKTIVVHHTAGPATGDAPSLNTVQNGRPDLAGPLAHFLLSREGRAYVVAAGLCYHAGAVRDNSYSNSWAVGIEMEGTGRNSWPSHQVTACAKLCAALCRHYGLPASRVLGHKEVCAPVGRKIDPNFDMANFRTLVSRELAAHDKAATEGDDMDAQDVWAWKNPELDKRDMRQILADAAAKADHADRVATVNQTRIDALTDQIEQLKETAAQINASQATQTAQLNAIAAQLAKLTGQTG